MPSREIVQIAIGPSACEVTAHGLNLQGLSIETCVPTVTHAVYRETYVPRAILVDHPVGSTPAHRPEEPEVIRLASALAFHPNSRYRVPASTPDKEVTYASTGRHVNWDDEEEEVPEEEDASVLKEQQAAAYERQVQSAQQPLEQYWKETSDPTEMLMPPYRPDTMFVTEQNFTSLQTYETGQSEDCEILWERIRQRLEECDSCQGVILSHAQSAHAGVATSLLREWKDECANKSSLVVACGDSPLEDGSDPYASTRSTMEDLLAMSDHSELADAVMPIASNTAADAAIALEAATLPFRLRPLHSRAVTLVSSAALQQDDFTGSLSFREFLRTLQRQSAHRNILNLSSCQKFDTHSLLSGTSVQRDLRMRQPGYAGGIHRGRDELPGQWLCECSVEGGLMSSWLPSAAPSKGPIGDRSLHYNFASTAAFRPTDRVALEDYSTCLQESLGIRYRPEQTMVTVVNESLADLVGSGYGAGSYWKGQAEGRSILATLDNSTRVYPNLHQACAVTERVVAPQSRKSLERSRYNQDTALGLMPELDDMKDALTALLDLRDSYTPPESSGLVFEGTEGDF